ncbi:MAG: hypothetical protein GXP27_09855 [Planctomycetes bacterium]|nr:hypothetical protein [Planctomycetota bacterium]
MTIRPVEAPGTLEVWLISPGKQMATRVLLTDERSLPKLASSDHVVRVARCPQPWDAATPAHVMVGATGNRILVGWDQRRLACAQPAQQSGRPFFWAIVARSASFRIVQMRIEGE